MKRFARLGRASAATLMVLASAAWADAQDDRSLVGVNPQAREFRCPNPESPRFRAFECHGVEPDFTRTLLSDWNGFRRQLATLGITPTFSYAGAYVGNTSNPPREGSFGSGFHASVNVDFERAAGAKGLSMYANAWWFRASNVDALVNTSLFPANSDFVGRGFALGQLYVQQAFADGELTIAAGRLAPGATFGTLPAFANYMNAAINPNPASLRLNDPIFAAPPPGSQWGIQSLYLLAPAWQLGIGVFNNNANSAAGGDHGLDWTLHQGNRGVLAVAQLNWHRNQTTAGTSLPGTYSAGAFVDTNDFPTISGEPAHERGNWGVYAMAQQQLGQPCGFAGSGGLTAWGTLAYGPRVTVSPMPVFAAAGASCSAPFAGRSDDVASIGWYYGKLSDRIQPPATSSHGLELNYQYAITPAISIVVDAQYLFRVNGYPSAGTAIFGAQIEINF